MKKFSSLFLGVGFSFLGLNVLKATTRWNQFCGALFRGEFQKIATDETYCFLDDEEFFQETCSLKSETNLYNSLKIGKIKENSLWSKKTNMLYFNKDIECRILSHILMKALNIYTTANRDLLFSFSIDCDTEKKTHAVLYNNQDNLLQDFMTFLHPKEYRFLQEVGLKYIKKNKQRYLSSIVEDYLVYHFQSFDVAPFAKDIASCIERKKKQNPKKIFFLEIMTSFFSYQESLKNDFNIFDRIKNAKILNFDQNLKNITSLLSREINIEFTNQSFLLIKSLLVFFKDILHRIGSIKVQTLKKNNFINSCFLPLENIVEQIEKKKQNENMVEIVEWLQEFSDNHNNIFERIKFYDLCQQIIGFPQKNYSIIDNEYSLLRLIEVRNLLMNKIIKKPCYQITLPENILKNIGCFLTIGSYMSYNNSWFYNFNNPYGRYKHLFYLYKDSKCVDQIQKIIEHDIRLRYKIHGDVFDKKCYKDFLLSLPSLFIIEGLKYPKEFFFLEDDFFQDDSFSINSEGNLQLRI